MDEYTGKRAPSAVGIAKRQSGLPLSDSNKEDRNIPICNRLGCSTRLNSTKGAQIGNSLERPKYSGTSFRPSSSKMVVGSSSKKLGSTSNPRKACQEQQISRSLQKTNVVESGSRLEGSEISKSVLDTADTAITDEVRDCIVASNSVPCKRAHQRSGLSNQNTAFVSSVHRSSSRNTGQSAKSSLQGQAGSNAHKHSLRNTGRMVTSGVPPSVSSSFESSRNKRRDTVRKPPDGESSSTRGKSTNGSSNQRNALSAPNRSIMERSLSQQPPRRMRTWSAAGNNVSSVRTRQPVNGNSGTRIFVNGNNDGLLLPEPNPQLPQTEILTSDSATPRSSQSSSTELPYVCQNSHGLDQSVISGSDSEQIRPVGHLENGIMRAFRRISMDREGLRRYNMEGIAEVLLALDRIEHDEALTYEQLLTLETNLFLGGLGFHDQHRDMRLDIDNMSYEELLALEEKMGTVSTALTEEELSKCLKKCFYTPTSQVLGNAGSGDDIKCSICQEEYSEGDEVARLPCDHRYHVVCIHQWLRQKNWCPICKTSASSS